MNFDFFIYYKPELTLSIHFTYEGDTLVYTDQDSFPVSEMEEAIQGYRAMKLWVDHKQKRDII